MSLIIALILSVTVLLILLVQPSRVIHIKLISVPAFCIVFILCLVLISETAVKAAVKGLNLWAGVVVPSLFPFFVASELMNSTGFVRAAGLLLEPLMRPFFNVPGCGSFPLAMGITSGYPVGAKITCDFRTRGDLTKSEAERLLAFTNNSGPLFIIGAVGTGMFGSHRLGIFLYICHVLACLTVGFMYRFNLSGIKINSKNSSVKRIPNKALKIRTSSFRARKKNNSAEYMGKVNVNVFKAFRKKLIDDYNQNSYYFGSILGDAIKNSVSTILAIGGFIVLFSVFIYILSESGIIKNVADFLNFFLQSIGLDKSVIEGVLSGIFEITTGSGLVSAASAVPAIQKLPAVSFIIGWAGLSVHFQVMSIISKTDLSIRPYLKGKLLQGIISAIYTWIGLKFILPDLMYNTPVLGSELPAVAGWLQTLCTSLWLVSAIIMLFILTIFWGRYKKQFKKQ